MEGKERLLAALNKTEVDRVPVWFMRQAGRHLPEYRKIAKEKDFWTRCMDVDICSKITLQPLDRYPEIDAAIVFSDILTPLPALGYEVRYGNGIRIDKFDFEQIDDWADFNARKDAPWAADALAEIGELEDTKARLGFAGCPWTISMYLLSGGTGDKDFHSARASIFSNTKMADELLGRVADVVGDLLADQVNYGRADAVQLFDTWAGLLSPEQYERFGKKATARAIGVFREKAKNDVPLIHYAKGSGHLHEQIRSLDIDAISLDWRDDLYTNRRDYGKDLAIQGNLDPSYLHGSQLGAIDAARSVLEKAGNRPGHIFNLGHGMTPDSKIENVEAVLKTVAGGIK
tara:strand:- start:648 stop:1682 length:1035 start_codon:yes stop_codon:yes gene_type:complete